MIKYLIMDVDGSITDGKIYMGSNGEVFKAFSIKDGCGIKDILPKYGITPMIITARESDILLNRCKELSIEQIYQGERNKLRRLELILNDQKSDLSSCAYFGDDILDLQCMTPIQKSGGIVGCPSDAVKEIRAVADYVCINKAGEGALREFTEWLVSDRSDDEVINARVDDALKFLKKLYVSEEDVGKKVEVNDYFFYSVQSYDTKPAEQCKLESHRKYIDIQIMVSGEESMDLVDISRLSIEEEYDEVKDVMFWSVPKRMSKTTLVAGDCIVLYPETAHRGAQDLNATKHVLKIVGKVAID